PWGELGTQGFASALAADRSGNALWIGYFRGGIAQVMDGKIHASYGAADGLGDGRVNGLRSDLDGTLWIATDGGLSRLSNGHIATLNSKNGLPCDVVHWMIEDDADTYWLKMPCGLVRIARTELHSWTLGAKAAVKLTVLDNSDGVRSYS